MTAELRGLVDSIQESARLLGQVQARKEAGNCTEADSRFEVAMHKAIAADKARIELSVAQGQGCVMVPRVPTEAILDVLFERMDETDEQLTEAWSRILSVAAAPAQPDGVSK